jgi:hypothetical protein
MSDVVHAETVGTVATEQGNLKRSLQMKMFASPKLKKEVVSVVYADANDQVGRQKYPKGIAGGQVVGNIWEIKEKVGQLPDGTSKMSLLAIGEFEAVSYETGEVFNSTAAYLPGYYLETVKSMMEKGGAEAIVCALEIVLVPTGKSVPFAYEVRNLITRRPDNPINRLKAEMQAAGRLRLAPPPAHVPLIEGEVRSMTPAEPENTASGEFEDIEHDPALDASTGPADTPADAHNRHADPAAVPAGRRKSA